MGVAPNHRRSSSGVQSRFDYEHEHRRCATEHEHDWLPDLALLQPGRNVISAGKTPLHDGKMVHGMEVNWPGMQMLIQYRR
jgi:hypothetical protein